MPENSSDGFDPTALIDRYELLFREQRELEAKVDLKKKQLESKQAEYNLIKKQRMNEILVKNSEVASAVTQLEQLNSVANEIEHDIQNKDFKFLSAASRYTQLQFVISNLHSKAVASCPYVHAHRSNEEVTDKSQEGVIQQIKLLITEVVERMLDVEEIIHSYSGVKKKRYDSERTLI